MGNGEVLEVIETPEEATIFKNYIEQIKKEGAISGINSAILAIIYSIQKSIWSNYKGTYAGESCFKKLGCCIDITEAKLSKLRVLLATLQELEPGKHK